MGKIARMLSAPLDENMADLSGLAGQVRYDPRLWVRLDDSGEYVHVCTGEVRPEEDFTFDGQQTSALFHPDGEEGRGEEGRRAQEAGRSKKRLSRAFSMA